ncbi:MAG: NAD(P)/FAD-dependent oxidoreductase [Thermodesulfovibrionaceae bacterium]
MDCEVLVVGGGPAGATAARFLAQAGIDTILIEKNLSFHKPCGGGVPSAGLKDLDLADEVEKIPLSRVKKIKIYPPFSTPIEVELKGGEIYIFNRFIFDSFLRELAKKKGAQIVEASLESLKFEKSRIISTAKKREGERINISSKYVIASDGVNSKVSSLLGLPQISYYWTVSLHIPKISNNEDCCEFWFGSSHASFFYSWVFPALEYLSVGTGAEKIDKLTELIKNFLKKRFGDKVNPASFKLKAYKIPRWSRRIFFKGNVFFTGDAIATVMPVSFEGIYYAMKSAQFAAQAIKEKNPTIYEKLWKERFLNQFLIMKKFQDFMFGNDKRMDQWLNIHRDPAIQELAMALWLRKEKGGKLVRLYLKAFSNLISKIVNLALK